MKMALAFLLTRNQVRTLEDKLERETTYRVGILLSVTDKCRCWAVTLFLSEKPTGIFKQFPFS